MTPVRLISFDQGKALMEEFVATTSYLNEHGELDTETLPEVHDPAGDEDSR
jgi:hypothetical protein